ncbi:MAG: Hsp70 family protein [Rickettsiales bacterium]
MNLLQISEPETKLPVGLSEHAVGIDLGTTNSVIAISRDTKVEILGPILPSIYQEIRSIKRLMGSNQKVKELRPEEISAQILLKLKTQAEKSLGKNVTKAVITVPAHFDDTARNATKIAANLAGLEVLRLINEPTAAALAYGLDHKAEGIYLIYDFGGGTFDISILNLQKGIFQVLATGGDINLGGDDIDHAIMKFMKLPEDLYYIARNAKEHLSTEDNYISEYGSISKEEFEKIAKPFINRTIDICRDTIKDSKVSLDNIKEIVLVGGSTRIPLVKTLLAENIKSPLDSIDPDLVVAMGAAIQAEALTLGSNNLLLDVTSLSIGLEVMGGVNERIIHKNSAIPCSITKYFTTYQDNQTGIVFHIVQGEREMASDCRSLAKFELKGIPPMKASLAKVAITFNVDSDGLLTVSAIEENSGIKQDIEIKPTFGLTSEEIDQMLEKAYANAQNDIILKKLAELKLSSTNNINSINQAILENGDLLENKKMIIDLISKLSELLKTDNFELIEETNNELETKTSKFIQTRLNLKLKEILSGRSTTDINNKILS